MGSCSFLPSLQIRNGMWKKKKTTTKKPEKKTDEKADQIFMLPAVILGVFPRIVHPDLCSILIQMA